MPRAKEKKIAIVIQNENVQKSFCQKTILMILLLKHTGRNHRFFFKIQFQKKKKTI